VRDQAGGHEGEQKRARTRVHAGESIVDGTLAWDANPSPPKVKDATAPLPKDAFTGGPVLACKACLQWITTAAAAIEIAGAHAHDRENPSGVRFRFGCFAGAAGLARFGSPSSFFTWFPGYTWQIEICDRCHSHVGWLFASGDGSFHGLILAALVEVQP